MPVHMYSTTVSAEKTAGEIQALLLKAGATDILIQAQSGVITGIAFRIETPHGNLPFTLPAQVERVHRVLIRDHEPRFQSLDQARRTAWRMILRWLQAQLSMIEADMVELEQIMLPFLQVDNERTLYEKMLETNYKLMLPEGNDHD